MSRLRRYFNEIDKLKDAVAQKAPAKCVIAVADDNQSITISYSGRGCKWAWSEANDGLIYCDSDLIIPVHPLAAESFVASEIIQFIDTNSIEIDDILFVNDIGVAVDSMRLHPLCLGPLCDDISEKKTALTYLYVAYVKGDGILTEEMIDNAKDKRVLTPFLSLVNL